MYCYDRPLRAERNAGYDSKNICEVIDVPLFVTAWAPVKEDSRIHEYQPCTEKTFQRCKKEWPGINKQNAVVDTSSSSLTGGRAFGTRSDKLSLVGLSQGTGSEDWTRQVQNS
jgi:hypothetical protein